MIDETLSDPNSTFAILGVANKDSLSAKALIQAARDLVPQAWQPTSDVLRITINRLLDLQYLRRAQNKFMAADAPLEMTSLGRQRLKRLMTTEPEPATISSHATFITLALQACLSKDQPTELVVRDAKNQQGRHDDYLFY